MDGEMHGKKQTCVCGCVCRKIVTLPKRHLVDESFFRRQETIMSLITGKKLFAKKMVLCFLQGNNGVFVLFPPNMLFIFAKPHLPWMIVGGEQSYCNQACKKMCVIWPFWTDCERTFDNLCICCLCTPPPPASSFPQKANQFFLSRPPGIPLEKKEREGKWNEAEVGKEKCVVLQKNNWPSNFSPQKKLCFRQLQPLNILRGAYWCCWWPVSYK